MTDLVDSAVEYQRRGYFVVPVRITVGADGKKQLDYAGESWSKYTLPAEPAQHFATGFGRYEGGRRDLPATGFVFDCGRSGIVVVESDVKNGVDGADHLAAAGIELTTPFTVRSQGGGTHHYYRADPSNPVRNSAGELAQNVDVRAVGGVIVAPGSWVEGGGSYDLVGDGGYLPAIADLPQLPARISERRSPRKAVAVLPGDWVAPVLTRAKRAAGARIAKAKLAQIEAAEPGQRNEVLKVTVPRIIGLAKTMSLDLVSVGDMIREAYHTSGGDDDRQIEDWIRNATARAVPDDHNLWDVDGDGRLSDAEFWASRPELAYIRTAALEATASPWAVLGALIPRVLSGVPASWTLDTKIGASRGNLNTFSVLAADSGGGKGLATEVAEHLWPVDDDDVLVTDTASGEALARLFASRDVFLRSSAIIDVDEYAALRASADRSGSTLAFKLSSAWSGKALSLTYADETRNVYVPAGSYRLGMIAGIQYGNARMLLSASDQIQGYAKRFMWFPADIDYEPDLSASMAFPAPMTVPQFDDREVSVQVPAEVTTTLRMARSAKSGMDGHSLYARVKLAYALAVLHGRTTSITAEDWELAGVVFGVSERTQAKAQAAMKARTLSETRSRGEMDGVRQSAAEEVAHAQALERVRKLVEKHKVDNPAITNGALRRKIAHRDKPLFDELQPKDS